MFSLHLKYHGVIYVMQFLLYFDATCFILLFMYYLAFGYTVFCYDATTHWDISSCSQRTELPWKLKTTKL